MITNSYSFLGQGGSVTASAGDISMNDHTLAIVGCPFMDFRKIRFTPGFKESLTEELQSWIYTPVAANSTTYTLTIAQYNNTLGRTVQHPLTYTSLASGDTATTICNALRAQLITLSDVLVTGTGTATLILTAQTGSPLFTVVNNQPVNSTVTSNQLSIAITSSTDATPIVVTVAATTGLQVGDSVTITGHLTNVAANGTWRVSVVTGTTFTLEGSVGSGAGAGSAGTVVQNAQFARGTYPVIVAQVPAFYLPTTGFASTQTYSQITFDWILEAGESNGMPNYSKMRHTLFVNEAATNYSNFKTRINEITNAFVASGTTANPETVSIGTPPVGGL